MSLVTDLLYPSTYVRAENNVPAWYEFLLKPELLENHLSLDDPDPSGCALIKQFFDQSNRSVNDQGQILPPPDNERNKTLKSLALQAAALLQWNVKLFEKELPISTRHQLLSEFMNACKTSVPPAPQAGLGNVIEAMHDHAVMSLITYCRWGARTVVKATFPCKPGGRITPTVPQSVPYQANAQQRCDEVRDQVLTVVKEQVQDIVQCLEAVLNHIKRPIYLPGHKTISSKELCKSIDQSKDVFVSFEELHAQICYDLACLHFTHNFYEKAGEMFGYVREWEKRMPEKRSEFCDFEDDVLSGYCTACHMILGVTNEPGAGDAKPAESENLFLKIEQRLKQTSSATAVREIAELVIEDVHTRQLSTAYVNRVERQVLYGGGGENEAAGGAGAGFDVRWSCALHRAVRGLEPAVGLWSSEMNLAQLQRIIGFVQQVANYLTRDETRNLATFLCSLANNLCDSNLQDQLLSFQVVVRCVDDDVLDELRLKAAARQHRRVADSAESPLSPEAPVGRGHQSASDQVMTLERTLLRTLSPSETKEVLRQLHALEPGRSFATHCAHWQLPTNYAATLSAYACNPLTHDFLHAALAKVRHCVVDREFNAAKVLLYYMQKTFASPSDQKLLKIVGNELLKIELIELIEDDSLNYGDAEDCGELRNQLSDVVTKCRHLLTTYAFAGAGEQSKLTGHAPGADLVELCVVMLLNLEDLTFFKSASRCGSSNAPSLRFACLLAAVRSGIVERALPDSHRKLASHEYWTALVAVFAGPAPPQSGAGGRGGAGGGKKHDAVRNLLPAGAVIARPALLDFVRLLKNSNMLQIFVSSLVHLHRLCRADLVNDVALPDSGAINGLWPVGLDGGATTSGASVTLALRDSLAHCLNLNPRNKSWLRAQADVNYAFNNFNAALRCYLLLGAYETKYFNEISSANPFGDEQIVQRLIKCCMQMRCFTQAAVFCQMLKEVDYQTAFKAIQENRQRADAGELHYQQHMWDVQLLEHAAFVHRESGENRKKLAAVRALSRPELNHSNLPAVGARVVQLRSARFLQAMARQYLC